MLRVSGASHGRGTHAQGSIPSLDRPGMCACVRERIPELPWSISATCLAEAHQLISQFLLTVGLIYLWRTFPGRHQRARCSCAIFFSTRRAGRELEGKRDATIDALPTDFPDFF